MAQRSPVLVTTRGHDRKLVFGQFQREGVLFQDSRITPSARTVELRDQRLSAFHTHLIDAIFVAVQGQQVTITHLAE